MATTKRLGKRPPKRDGRNFKFSKYRTRWLPPPPPAIDHASLVKNWPMFKNDVYGDCGPAGAAHQIQSWSTYAKHPLTPTEKQVVDFYFTITGGKDEGVYLAEMNALWQKVGLGGEKIEAYVEIDYDHVEEAKLAIQLFGSCGVGMSLPNQNTFGPWIVPTGSPNPRNGHYVCAVAYDDATERFKVVTWGELVDMSYAWFEKYCDEAVAILDDISLLEETMETPEGFNFAELRDDLDHLSDPIEPPQDPPPAPEPPPEPQPPPAPEPGGCNLLARAIYGLKGRGWRL